jgi:hypothetical protein
MFTKNNIILFLILVASILYQVAMFTKENWDSCYNYARAHDNFMRKFTKPHWIAKTDNIPQYSPYYDHTNYIPIGTLTNIKNNVTFTLFGEKNPSGGGVIFYYLYETPDGSGRLFPFQFDKELFTGDFVRVPNINDQLLVKVTEYGVGTGDAPYPYTFQPNVI